MSPIEEDVTMWASICQALKQLWNYLSFAEPFLAPAFVGSIIRAMSKKHRSKPLSYLLRLVLISTLCGGFLTPLAVHVFPLPLEVAGSVAVMIGIMGNDALDGLETWAKKRMGVQSDAAEEQES